MLGAQFCSEISFAASGLRNFDKIGMAEQNLQFFTQLITAVLLGAFVGLERELQGKAAGFRTYALVAMGSCLFTIISVVGVGQITQGVIGFDPSRIASQIVVGIGFLGAGLIIFQESKIHGLTTAAGLWAMAGVGVAAGMGYFTLAVLATALVLVVLWGLRKLRLEERIHKLAGLRDESK